VDNDGQLEKHQRKAKVRSLVLDEGARLLTYSEDPSKARLALTWHGKEGCREGYGPPKGGAGAVYRNLPRKIDVVIKESLQLDGVLFDHVKKGGILLANPAIRRSWKNVFFGEHNEGSPDELFAKYQPPLKK
jgi:hypothetical protein